MPSDTIHAFDAVIPRVKALEERVTHFKALRGRLQKDLVSKETEVVELSTKIDKLRKVEELFKALMDALVVKQVRVIEDIATEGLQTIFYDQDLYFETDVAPKYNKISIDFFLRQGSKQDPLSIRGKPLDSFGGGPNCVVSVILKVLTLQRMQKFPLLALDEALNAVSEVYVEGTGQFLRALCEKMGMDVMLITHKTSFADHADHSYHCREVVDGNQRFLQAKKAK